MARRVPRRPTGDLTIHDGGGGTTLTVTHVGKAAKRRARELARVKDEARSKGGRPTLLTDRTEDVIVNAVLDGNHLTAASRLAGVHPRTLHRWVERGETCQQRIDDGEEVTEDDLRFVAFCHRLHDARAQAESQAVKVIRTNMFGGQVISEQYVVDVNGEVQYDRDTGKPLVNRTYSQPDGRLALQYLARSRPEQWGNQGSSEIRVTGGDGGPVHVVHEVAQIDDLASRLAQIAAERREEGDTLMLGAGDVVPGEVVEDGAHDDHTA